MEVFYDQNCQLGSNSMCCARTAALQGETKAIVSGLHSFVQQFMHNVQKCPKTVSGQAKTCPRRSQDRSKQARNSPRQAQTGPRQVKTGQDRPKTVPRQAPDRPKQAQDSPKQTQDSSQAGHDRPRQPQDRPRQAPRSDLDRIVVVQNHAKPQFFLWFPPMNTILLQKLPKGEKSANMAPTCPGQTLIWKPSGPP